MKSGGWRRIPAIALLTLALGGAAACGGESFQGLGASGSRGAVGSYRPADPPLAAATRVTVGVYGLNAYDLDAAANTFYFNGYLWLIWTGDRDPSRTLEITNVVNQADFVIESTVDEPDTLASGAKIIWFKISGRFFQPFDLRDYPLDKQQLTLMIEDSTFPQEKVVFEPDTMSSGLDSRFQVPGWSVAGLTAERLTHDYGSSFGADEASESLYSVLQVSVHLSRGRNLFLWKLLLPLLLVLGTNWLALVLHPRLVEVRTAMPATALLTMVFLQQSALDGLPPVSALVLMDRIYLVAYIIIVATFARMVWDNNRLKRSDDEIDTAMALRRSDRIILAVQMVAGLGALAFLAASRL